MRVRSFAKINLGVEIIRTRADGYHEILTLFQSIDFFDELEFRLLPENRIILSGSDMSIPWGDENLIYRAALELKQHTNCALGVEIWVEKKIPAGKGLGGGSSNAAMTLYALNQLWELGCDKTELQLLGSRIGADVPYFLLGGLCLGSGKGDELRPLTDLPTHACVLLLPDTFVPTAEVYANLPKPLTSEGKDSKISRFLNTREFCGLENGLEESVFRLYPQIKAIKSLFQNLESKLFLVSGSGSAVFCLFGEPEKAEQALKELDARYRLVLTETVSRERYWKKAVVGV